MRFGDVLSNLLTEQEITQKELSARLNIAASTLSSYVQNKREPDFEMVKAFAKYFNVSTDYLLGYSSQKCVESSPFFKPKLPRNGVASVPRLP